jgi:hypothetical protein
MEHDDRMYWVNEIEKINQRRNEEDTKSPVPRGY